ncbi:FimV/HubP family polar landmark protein [Shewanella saliphila]|uniref:LysM domain-containing protein n=1 Tax=Shewanella saliphila TaxID=2282698 RepID=A0ABQ2Q237_9GAMM|nr:FimV/HubP family polar landmark protein [Shewanella saliphila]MCL1100658.1 hypothetical protein [Shewanella saliphila]GGP41513.1 hypothetical protein GCM10009409_05430 [Shewanella saliphila]
MKGVKLLVILAFMAVGQVSAVVAEVSHISIDTAAFERGKLPTLTVNVVTEHHDLSRLTFYLRQIYQDNIVLEKLDVERQGNDVFLLNGKEQLRDPDAALIVSEFRNAKWQQYSPVPLFSPVLQVSNHHPVAIKKMKLPSSSIPASTTTATTTNTVSRVVDSTPVLAQTQELLEGCNILKQPDDSLWKIAVRYRKQWNSNIYGAMLALYESNPQAFYQGNISMLQLDSSLRCPPADILVKYQNVKADRVTFDNLVVSQQGKATAVVAKTPSLPTVTTDSVLASTTEVEPTLLASTQEIAPVEKSTPIAIADNIAESIVDTSIDINVSVDADEMADTTDEMTLSDSSLCVIDKRPEDNLWRVAVRNQKQLHTNVYGTMLAIFDANPQAFVNNKIYLLMADSVLICPSEAILQQYQDATKDRLAYEAFEQQQRQP